MDGDPMPCQMYPIAELHWSTAVRRYGFPEAEALESHWTSCCGERIRFALDRNCNQMSASVGGLHPQVIRYGHCLKLHTLIKEGYVLKKTVFCRHDSLGVVSLMGKGHLNNASQKRRKHAIVCVDIHEGTVVSCLEVKTSDGKNNICDLEVWECDISQDGRLLIMAVALMIDENFAQDSCENFVSLYDREYNREVKRIWNWDNVVCGLGFDPRFSHSQYVLVGMRQTLRDKTSLAVYDVAKKQPIRKVPVGHLIDREGETYFQLRFSRDGDLLVLQVIENVAYAREWLYRTLIYNMETLQLLCTYQPANTISCHVDCVPRTFPIISVCNSHMALASFRGKPNRSRTLDIDLYRLPVRLDLKNLCRTAIIKGMRDVNKVQQLPLPTILKHYLQWRPVDDDWRNTQRGEGASNRKDIPRPIGHIVKSVDVLS